MSAPRRQPLRPQGCTVVLIDDEIDARRRVRAGLAGYGIAVIGEAGDARHGVVLAAHIRPEVVLMDLLMPGTDGVAATAELLRRWPEARVLMLTDSEDEELGLLGLRAGALGHLVKHETMAEIARGVRQAAAGAPVLGPVVAQALVANLRAMPNGGVGVRPVRSPLTRREWEVLDLLCLGRTIDGVADELVLSRETVRSHVKRILRKLGVHNQADAIRAATGIRGAYGLGVSDRVA